MKKIKTYIYEALKLGKKDREKPFVPKTRLELIKKINELDIDNPEVIDVSNFDLSEIKSISGAFQYMNCTHIIGLDKWDVSNITDFSNVFAYCTYLEEVRGTEYWNMSNAQNCRSMFKNCISLTTIDIDNWKLDKLMAADYMFFNCNKLVSIKGVDKLNNNHVQCNNIFSGCKYKPLWLINK